MQDVRYVLAGEEIPLLGSARTRIDTLYLLVEPWKAAPLALAIGAGLAGQTGRRTLLLEANPIGAGALAGATGVDSTGKLFCMSMDPGVGLIAGGVDSWLHHLEDEYEEIVVVAARDPSVRRVKATGSSVVVVEEGDFTEALKLAAMLSDAGAARVDIAVLTDSPVTSENSIGGLWEPGIGARSARLEAALRESGAGARLRLLPRDDGLLVRVANEGARVLEDHASHPFCQGLSRLARRLGGLEVGIALGAGLAKGFAHIGVLRVFAEEGIPVDYIAGASIGAIVGSVYAGGMPLGQLEALMTGADRRFLRPTLPLKSISSNAGLKKVLTGCHERAPTAEFPELFIPFTAVATDLMSGSEVVIDQGTVWKAVMASVSMPGIFPPVPLAGRVLVDGGLVNPVPAKTVREMGADIVIAVDLTSPARRANGGPSDAPNGRGRAPNLIETLWRTMEIMIGEITYHTAASADLTIRPRVRRSRIRDFSRRGPEIVAGGEKAARLALSEIRALTRREEVAAA